jgi:hypothetical protein
MAKLIVEIEYTAPYPLLVQDVEWALQDKTPNSRVSVREIRPTKRANDGACAHKWEQNSWHGTRCKKCHIPKPPAFNANR